MSWDDFLPSIISVFCPQYNTIRSTQNQNFVWLGNVLKQKVKLVSDQASSGQCSFLSCYRRLSWSQRQRGCWASRWYHLLWLPLAWTLQEGAPEGIGMEVFIMGWVKEVCLLVEPPLPTTPKKTGPPLKLFYKAFSIIWIWNDVFMPCFEVYLHKGTCFILLQLMVFPHPGPKPDDIVLAHGGLTIELLEFDLVLLDKGFSHRIHQSNRNKGFAWWCFWRLDCLGSTPLDQ